MSNTNFETIAYQLRRARIARGMSQEEIAARTGMLQPHISRAEGGVHPPSLRTIIKYLQAVDYRLEVVPDE